MTEPSLPPVAEPVLIAAVEALPNRLRKKLDEATGRYADRPVSEVDGRYVVEIDESTTVTLAPENGVVRSPAAATCTCLLAPNCLHRAAVLARAPVDGGATTAATESPATAESPATTRSPAGETPATDGTAQPATGEPLTVEQTQALAGLWRSAAAVLAAGATGSGAVARTALLRAAHDAQANKVYRPAAAARAVANLLQAARTSQDHYRQADLVATLRELLGVAHQLQRAGGAPPPGLLGTARRGYQLAGSLRLYGLCTTAVLSDSGYAGVLSYLVDRDGAVWMVADLMPGDASRAARAGDATVALGETALSHRALARAGLVVSAATASATRQLGAGKGVRAVTAAGVAWHAEPLAGLWAPPLGEQVHRAFEALALPVTDRAAGSDLLYLSVRVLGTGGDAVHAATPDGSTVELRVASDHPALAYRENLAVLGRYPGLDLMLIGRPEPNRPGTVYPLAVAPPLGNTWTLPEPYGGHADLAFDRLHHSQLRYGHPPTHDGAPAEPVAGWPGLPAATAALPRPAGDPALDLLRSQVERTVSGGRSMLRYAAGRGPSDVDKLRRAGLETGAALLDRLVIAANSRPRDAFGRLIDDDSDGFARAWLAAAVYADAATRASAEARWLAATPVHEAPWPGSADRAE